MIWKSLQHITKGILLLLKDLSEQNLHTYDFNIKNMYIDELNDIVNKYNNRHQSAMKMHPVDLKSST